MPIYEYQCPKCGHVFEEWVRVSTASDTAICPKCEATATHIISNTAFILKGGGWYVTEYGNHSAADTSQNNASHTSESSSTSKTDATDKNSKDSANTAAQTKSDTTKATKNTTDKNPTQTQQNVTATGKVPAPSATSAAEA